MDEDLFNVAAAVLIVLLMLAPPLLLFRKGQHVAGGATGIISLLIAMIACAVIVDSGAGRLPIGGWALMFMYWLLIAFLSLSERDLERERALKQIHERLARLESNEDEMGV
jgi:hypothetical protein